MSGTWYKANSPYNIQGAIMIANDSTLTIEPGVSVIFQGGYKLLVMGRLLAVGTITDSIIFTAADTAIGWRGIRFDNTPSTNDTSKFLYCKITYGKAIGSGEDANGGAFYFGNFSKVIINKNTISNNFATYSGGGISCGNSNPIISNSTIINNYGSFGSGIYCIDSSPIISNNIISNNSASSYGGGIFSYLGTPNIINNIISNNSANSGGGICFNNNFFNPTISNNSISNNSASDGGGIFCNNSSPTISNNTISNNTAKNGGALFCLYSSNPNFLNSLIWGNTTTVLGNQVYLEGDSSDPNNPNFYFCNIQGGKAGFGLNTNVSYNGTYSNNIDSDPLFVTPSIGSGTTYDGVNADWSLLSGSPCINAGDSLGNYPSTDKAGNPRNCDGRIDIGAYEFQKTPCNTASLSMEKPERQISIFPNPTNNKFYVDIENINNEKVEISLINILGQEMKKTNYNHITTERFLKEIEINDLAEQIYLVRLKINEQVYLSKISKIK